MTGLTDVVAQLRRFKAIYEDIHLKPDRSEDPILRNSNKKGPMW